MSRLFLFTLFLLFSSTALPATLQEMMDGNANPQDVPNIMQQFTHAQQQAGSHYKDLYSVYNQYIDKLGVRRIEHYLQQQNPACHEVAHALGSVISQRLGNLEDSMLACNDTCNYACIHGVFKVYFEKLGKQYHQHQAHETPHSSVNFTQPELQRLSQDINQVCQNSNEKLEGFYSGNCAHGMGHSLATLAGSPALAKVYCQIFQETEMKYYCETGVYMEMASEIGKHIFPGDLSYVQKVQRAIDYCKHNSNYLSACLRFLAYPVKDLGQITRFAKNCVEQSGKKHEQCFNAMGYLSRKYIASNPDDINYACFIGSRSDRHACISGISLMTSKDQYQQQIKLACNKLSNRTEMLLCKNQLKHHYYQLGNQQLREML